jgi:type III restriction enzyme
MNENFVERETDVVYIPISERDSPSPASWIAKTPGVCGGDARIRRKRLPVWLLVEMRQNHEMDEDILANYPDLTPKDLEAAWEYYQLNKAEVDEALARQEEAMRS